MIRRGRHLAVRAPADRGDRGQPVLHRRDAAHPPGARGAGAEPDRGPRGRQGDDLAPPAAAQRDHQPGAERGQRRRPPVRPARCSRSSSTIRSTRLEEATEAGLVREADQLDHFVFAHALVRETLYDGQSTSRRVRLHRRIGEALESQGDANPAELAYHFSEGRSPQAADYALDAAEQAAAAFAYEEAAEHYRRAGDDVPTLLALGAMELRAGDPAFRETFATRVRPRRGPRGAGRGRARLLRPPRRGGRDRPRGHRPARAGARARSPRTTSSPSRCAPG